MTGLFDEPKTRKFLKWTFRYKNKEFNMHTGMTARKQLSLVPLSETYIRDEAEKTISIAKDMFPYLIYTNKKNRYGEMNIPNDSYICFYNLNDKLARHVYIKVKDIYEHDTNWFVNNVSRRLGTANAAMSFCTFYKENCKKKYIFSINALVLDIDCFNSEQKFYEGTEKWCVQRIIEEDHMNRDIPVPTYIEEGRQFRYIYVLEEPIYVANYSKSIKFAQKIMNTFADRIKYLGGDRQQLNSFVRLEGSANVKGWAGHVEHEVIWRKYSNFKYSFQDIIDEFIPEYVKPKKTSNKRKKSKRSIIDYAEHNRGVLKMLCKIQEFYNKQENNGHREKLCFMYRNFAYLIYDNPEKAKEMMLEFNNGFNIPLIEKEVVSATNNVNYRRYKYKTKTMLDDLGVTYEDIDWYKPVTANRKEYRHQVYIKKEKKFHKEREKKTKKIKSTVLKLKLKGKKNIEIVKELLKKGIELSVKSIERYVTGLIKEGLYSPI